MALHVVLGGVYLGLAGFQFVGRFRARHPGYHFWMGRFLVLVGLIMGAAGLFMGLFIPIAGWVERGYVAAFGAFFLVALIKGWVHVRAGRVAWHREWMIRAFAIGLAAATQRLIVFPVLFVVVPDPTRAQIAVLAAVSFLTAFGAHTVLAEVWIRLTRRSSVLGTHASEAA